MWWQLVAFSFTDFKCCLALGRKRRHAQTRGLLFSSVCQCDANELVFCIVFCLIGPALDWELTLRQKLPQRTFIVEEICVLCFYAIYELKFDSEKESTLECDNNMLSTEVCKMIIIEAINVIGNVIFCFPDSLVLLNFRLHMPEKHFLVLMSLSTRQLLKSALSIKQPTYLYPICQWKLPCLRKMDGLRITFHRPLSCPHIT